jgi:hypothetical protein
MRIDGHTLELPISSINGVKEKTLFLWVDFSWRPARQVWLDSSYPTFRELRTLRHSRSGFDDFCVTKPVRSEINDQRGCQVPTMALVGTRGT